MNFHQGRLLIEFIVPRLGVHRADVGAKYYGENLFKRKKRRKENQYKKKGKTHLFIFHRKCSTLHQISIKVCISSAREPISSNKK